MTLFQRRKKIWRIDFVEENKENIPTEQALIDTVKCFNLEEVLNLVKMGNKDKWNSHYVEYLGVYEEE